MELDYRIQNLPADMPFTAFYSASATVGLGGTVRVQSGTLVQAQLVPSGVFLASTTMSAPMSASLLEWVQPAPGPITGVATLPQGASATLTNDTTGKQITLKNGGFSIPSGVGAPGALPPAGAKTIRCTGGPTACTATVPIAGGASNRKLIIKLTDTNLRLESVTAVPKSSSGAYLLTDGRLALGGSEYRVTVNAVKGNPKGAHIVMQFGTVK